MKHYCKECGRLRFESYCSEEDDETFDEEYECDCVTAIIIEEGDEEDE